MPVPVAGRIDVAVAMGTTSVTVTVADDAENDAVAAYEAKITFAPADKLEPATERDAVAIPPEPVNWAVPNVVAPSVKVTEPLGAIVPDAAVTDAVRTVLPIAVKLVGLAATVVPVAIACEALHCVARLLTSRDPRPVVWS